MDGASPLALLKVVTPLVPTLSYTALTHSVGWSETSSKWDLKTALMVSFLRNMTGGPKGKTPPPIDKIQQRTFGNSAIKGKIWIAKDTFKTSEGPEAADGVAATVVNVVNKMAKGPVSFVPPKEVDIEVEWTGYRPNAGKNDPLPNISEAEKYKALLAEPTRTSDVTWLYFHGGAYYLCDPISHRSVTSRLAKESGGQVCSVRYRLAPQQAWPGQIVDGLHAYLSLLYPPPGSLHTAIPASKIVFAGDSAGGNLTFGLLQLLLQLHRASPNPTITFHGRSVSVPLPAAASSHSPWLDLARNMPSQARFAKYDYLPAPDHDDAVSRFPTTPGIWPSDPPRGDLVLDLSLIDHPLVTLVLAEDWSGSPPMWICTGEEALTDEDLIVARKAARQGVTVQFEQYEAMPHCFGMLMPFLPTASRLMKSWGGFARRVVEGEKVVTNGVYVKAKSGVESELDVTELETIDDGEVARLVAEAKERRYKGWDKEGKGMPKPSL